MLKQSLYFYMFSNIFLSGDILEQLMFKRKLQSVGLIKFIDIKSHPSYYQVNAKKSTLGEG